MTIPHTRIRVFTAVVTAFMLGNTVHAALAIPLRQTPTKPRIYGFYTGADLSELPVHERSGLKYSDSAGAANLLTVAHRNGWNIVRVRLWVHPNSDPKNAVSKLTSVTALGRRIKAAGMKFMLDIHYSDFWADPGHQKKPAAWANLPFPQLVRKTHDYTRDVVKYLRQNQAKPDFVQVGNETRNGLLYGSGLNGSSDLPGGGFWEKDGKGVDRAILLFQAGLQGVADGSSPGKCPVTIIHMPDGQDTSFVKNVFSMLSDHGAKMSPPVELHFDVVGLSYYPGHPWDHKAGYPAWRLSHLAESMKFVAEVMHKPVMIVETAWPYSGTNADTTGTPEFAFTPDGQAQYFTALIKAVKAVPNGLGIGVIPWDMDTLNWDSVFDSRGKALPAVRVLGAAAHTPSRGAK